MKFIAVVKSDAQGWITLPPEADVYPGQRFMRRTLPDRTIVLTPLPLLSSQF